jgi:nucleoside-diphosphate-sugar epimerase
VETSQNGAPRGGRTLVTGGAGYVGSLVVEELLGRGHSVRVLDNLIHGTTPSLLFAWGEPGFEFVAGDVRDAEVRRAALGDVDAVVHLAAIVGDPACSRDPHLARQVNLEATEAMIVDAQAAGVRRFVFASTCSNYGKQRDSSVHATEDFELRPISVYAETKVAAEEAVLAYSDDGIEPCCLRFATVYGASPRMRFDLTVNEFTRDLTLGGTLTVYGEQFWRPYVHVRDAAKAVALAVEAPREAVHGAVFNVGETDENYRKLDLVELLRERIPEAEVEFVHRDEDPRDYRVSFEKVKSELGFEADWSVGDGVDEIMGLLDSGLLGDPYASHYAN